MRDGGAPHRSGAALRRRSRPRTALEAQPSDTPCPDPALSWVGKDRYRRAPVKEPSAVGPRRLPSIGAPLAPLARRRETRHLPAALPPSGRLPAPRLKGLGPPSIQGLSPRCSRSGAACRLLQSLRSSSTTADRPTTPRIAPGLSLARRMRAAMHLAVHRRPSCLRARGHRELHAPASASAAIARRELCPDPIGSGTSCHGIAPAPAGEAERRLRGTSFPRIRRRSARNAPAAPGLRPPPLREEERETRTRGAFHRQAASWAEPVVHRLFPTCGISVWCLWHRRPFPGR
jgi:hypothetical protein